jgi:hypothetical protein
MFCYMWWRLLQTDTNTLVFSPVPPRQSDVRVDENVVCLNSLLIALLAVWLLPLQIIHCHWETPLWRHRRHISFTSTTHWKIVLAPVVRYCGTPFQLRYDKLTLYVNSSLTAATSYDHFQIFIFILVIARHSWKTGTFINGYKICNM